MATSKTLTPTNVTIQIPDFTDRPDQRANSNCIDKEADAINALNSQIANLGFITVNGTTGANAHAENIICATFPTGYNESNCIVVGSMIKYSDDKWYSNFTGNEVSTNDIGIWCKTASSGFSNKPIKIVLMKV